MQQAMFDTRHQVGKLATERYPGGIFIQEDHTRHEESVRSTIEAMRDRVVQAVFEAAFLEDEVRIRADILDRQLTLLATGDDRNIETEEKIYDKYFIQPGRQNR